MSRAAKVYWQHHLAGTIRETDEGYEFAYDPSYLQEPFPPVSLTLPRRAEPYASKILFPFFDGLIPEGWLLDIAETSWKIDRRDRMGLLLSVCRDCIGAVSIRPKP